LFHQRAGAALANSGPEEKVYTHRDEVLDLAARGKLRSAMVQSCDLGGAELPNVHLEDLGLRQVGLTTANLAGSVLRAVTFQSCGLRSARFNDVRLQQVNVFASELLETSFRAAELDRCRFYDSKLGNASFAGARVVLSAFHSVEGFRASFERATLIHCEFHDVHMGNAILSGASFRDALLIDVDLQGANLYGADFTNALLVRCDLRDANLVGARLDGARFVASRLERADLDEAARRFLERGAAGGLTDYGQIREGLTGRATDDLQEIIYHLVRTYAMEGTQPFKPETVVLAMPKYLRELDFAQLIGQLQKQMDLPELALFTEREGSVYVRLGGRDFLVSPNVIVDLQQSRQRDEAPAEPAPAARPAAPSPAAPAVESEERQRPAKAPSDTGGTADRFKMLDLD
jgi:uncharacterized protein YjbI with pentapeptide repeats